MATRDMIFNVTGVLDYKNHAMISVSQSIDPGQKYFDYVVEEPEEGLVRLDAKAGQNYFQYLGPNKTRHIAIWNTDPKIDYVPSTMMNYMMSSVLYVLMFNLEKFAKSIENGPDESNADFFKYFSRKKPFYETHLEYMLV